eukprot:Nk52_evm1s2425 gene=Nk52_evmTU1s2425
MNTNSQNEKIEIRAQQTGTLGTKNQCKWLFVEYRNYSKQRRHADLDKSLTLSHENESKFIETMKPFGRAIRKAQEQQAKEGKRDGLKARNTKDESLLCFERIGLEPKTEVDYDAIEAKRKRIQLQENTRKPIHMEVACKECEEILLESDALKCCQCLKYCHHCLSPEKNCSTSSRVYNYATVLCSSCHKQAVSTLDERCSICKGIFICAQKGSETKKAFALCSECTNTVHIGDENYYCSFEIKKGKFLCVDCCPEKKIRRCDSLR